MLKTSLIGAGYWGTILIKNLSSIQGISLNYVCDKNPLRLEHLKKKFPSLESTRFVRDLKQINDSDIAIIATPASTHFNIAKKCIENGMHVFIEKPLTIKAKEAKELIQLAEKHRVKLGVDHLFLYNPAVEHIKKLIDNNSLGNLHYIKCGYYGMGPTVRGDVNIVYDFAPHHVSMMLYWLNLLPTRVLATGQKYIDKYEDVASITLEFPNKVYGYIFVSWHAPGKIRFTEIVGSQKMIVFDDTQQEKPLTIYDQRYVRKNQKNVFNWTPEILGKETPTIEYGNPLKNGLIHFFDCVENDKKSRTDGIQGLRVVQILEAANDSLRKGGITVKFDENYGL